MHRQPIRVLFGFVQLLSALRAGAAVRQIIADGSPDMYWIARAEQDQAGAWKTIIQSRHIGGGSWLRIAQLNQRVISITHRGTELAVLLESGYWMLLWEDGGTSGSLPEDGSRLMTLGCDRQELWAIATAGNGRKPTTAGATQPAASLPSGARLLTRLVAGRWKMIAALPQEAQQGPLALACTGGEPMLATLHDGAASIITWNDATRSWAPAGSVAAPADTTAVKILTDLDRPMIWLNSQDGGQWSSRSANWSEPAQLPVPSAVSRKAVKDITVAGRTIRLVLQNEDGKVREYSFDPDGRPRAPGEIPLPLAPTEPRSPEWFSSIAAALLVMVLLNSMRNRTEAPADGIESIGLRLAPYGRRLLAGLIDALPLVGSLLFIGIRRDLFDFQTLESSATAAEVPLYVGLGIYLLHTTTAETLWGWTLGKRIFGLRVVMVDGSRPTAMAILIRNAVRVVDFFLIPMIFIQPLRQRAGDVAAETIVVMDPIELKKE